MQIKPIYIVLQGKVLFQLYAGDASQCNIFSDVYHLFFLVSRQEVKITNFGSTGHNSLIQKLNVLSSKKKISSKFS